MLMAKTSKHASSRNGESSSRVPTRVSRSSFPNDRFGLRHTYQQCVRHVSVFVGTHRPRLALHALVTDALVSRNSNKDISMKVGVGTVAKDVDG